MLGTNPLLADTDGFDDGLEVALGTDPLDPLSFPPLPAAVPALHPVGTVWLAGPLVLAATVFRRLRARRDPVTKS